MYVAIMNSLSEPNGHIESLHLIESPIIQSL